MSKQLKTRMQEQHDILQKEWFEQVIGAYPSESHKYFAKVENEFTNPVGSNIYRNLGLLLDELSGGADGDVLCKHLEMIMRIRAVQDMKPSKAVAFLSAFKSILRKQFQQEIASGEISQKELDELFSDLDTLSLIAFDLYMESKVLVYELRIAQIKETNDLLQKANLLNESVDTSTLMRCSNYIEEEKEL